MMATLANVGPMFGGVRPVVQHWPTLPPPLATLGRTLANVRITNVGLFGTQCLATILEKGSLRAIMTTGEGTGPDRLGTGPTAGGKQTLTEQRLAFLLFC